MKIYTVHRRPGAADTDLGSVRFVRDGFAWWGFLLPLLWLLAGRLWLATLVFLAVSLALGALIQLSGIAGFWALLATLPVNLYVGLEGRQWQRAKLARLGFIDEGIVAGRTLEEAELAYFARLRQGRAGPGATPPAAARPILPAPAPGIGLFPPPGRPV